MITPHKHRVVIVGGGFAGLYAAREFANEDHIHVTLIDKQNFHLFQPLLYQVATAGLMPGDIAMPVRSILNRQENTQVVLAEASGIDTKGNRVLTDQGAFEYDHLIVGLGAGTNYFNHDEWAEIAPGLKTIEDALTVRKKILMAFEAAELSNDPDEIERLLTFVVIGGGPTGVEMAGAIQEIAATVMQSDFKRINTAKTRVVLVEAMDRVLPMFSEESSRQAARTLENMGVEIYTGCMVTEIAADHVKAGEHLFPAKTALWTAGVKPSPVVESLGVELKRGRVPVKKDLSVSGHENIFVIGDLCALDDEEGNPLPGLAPVAMQQGKHAAKNILAQLKGEATEPFAYTDLGQMATIGRAAAVAEIMGWRSHGFVAWLMWLFVHIMQLVGFRNKLAVFIEWIYAYFAFRRSARLIVGPYATAIKPKRPEVSSNSTSSVAAR